MLMPIRQQLPFEYLKRLLGEFSLSGLTSNFAAQTLEIAIRMDIDANGILHVDAEEARSGAKALFIFG
ncbi:unnamed protein product, partial [Rotaria magnacalcarata]